MAVSLRDPPTRIDGCWKKFFSDGVSAGAIRPRPRIERRNSHMRGWNETFTKLAANAAKITEECAT
jgi:hypothetical protein